MSRIVAEDGTYAPEQPVAGQAPEPVDPRGLPQRKPDRYANVDVSDFTDIQRMNTQQMLAMADIAVGRGESDHAMQWRLAAQARISKERSTAERDAMLKSWEPKRMPPPGSRIVDAPGTTPWEQDAEYRKLQAAVTAAADATAGEMSPQARLETDQALAEAQAALSEREALIRDQVTAGGLWTEQDERVLEAQQSLSEKAADLI